MKFSSPASHGNIQLIHNAVGGSGFINYTLDPHRAIMFLATGNVTTLTGVTFEGFNGNTGGFVVPAGINILPITVKSITVDKNTGTNFRLFILK